MKKKTIILLCLLLNLLLSRKKILSLLTQNFSRNAFCKRKIYYQNKSESELTHLKLQISRAAYKSRNTPLVRRKLEDRKKDLYYAKPMKEADWFILMNKKPYEGVLDDENLFIKLPKPLAQMLLLNFR